MVAVAVDHLRRLELIREVTGKIDRLFAYGGHLDILNEGTDQWDEGTCSNRTSWPKRLNCAAAPG